MTYIDKILEEFDEKFVEYEICDNPDHIGLHSGLYGTDNKRLGCPCCGSDEEYRIKSTARISKKPEELKSFFATSIDQAVAEERERVRGIVKRTIGINTTTTFDEVVYKNGIDVKEYINKYDLISSLDRPDK